MKKVITLALAVLLVFSMMIMLAACGDKDKFIGAWETETDFTNVFKDTITDADEELAEYIEFGEVKFKYIYEFNEDGTYKIYLQEEALDKAVKDLRRNYTMGIKKYFEELINDQALNMTVDEVLAQSDTSLETLVDEALGEEAVNSWKKAAKKQGNFKVSDGKLYLSAGLEYSIDTDKYETYEITDETLKILGTSSKNEELESLGLAGYPIVLKKIA